MSKDWSLVYLDGDIEGEFELKLVKDDYPAQVPVKNSIYLTGIFY